jgi:glycosyltransferase involved in cell wall biosynthesis
MDRKVLVASFEVPGASGSSTAAYQLFQMLQLEGFDVFFVNLIPLNGAPYVRNVFGEELGNPNRLGNCINCSVSNSLADLNPELHDLIKDLNPDLILGMDHDATLLVKRCAPEKLLILLTAECRQIKGYVNTIRLPDFCRFSRWVEQRARPPLIYDWNEMAAVQCADLIVAQSDITRFLYTQFYPDRVKGKLYPDVVWSAEWQFGEMCRFGHLRKPFAERDIDVLFVAGRWDRSHKNPRLVEKIIRRCSDLNVQIVGEVKPHPDHAKCLGVIANRHRFIELLGRTKTLVSASLYDPAPVSVFEASAMGCNIVASKNCGSWKLCNSSLLVEQYTERGFLSAINRSVSGKLKDNRNIFLERGSYKTLTSIISTIDLPVKTDAPPRKLLVQGSLPLAGSPRPAGFTRTRLKAARIQLAWRRKCLFHDIKSHVYDGFVNILPRPAIKFQGTVHSAEREETDRIAYYIWRFPTLSQTFVHREVAALRESGLTVKVYAGGIENRELLGEDARSLIEITRYIEPMDDVRRSRAKRKLRRRRPFLCLKLLLYIVAHRYQRDKSLKGDVALFNEAIYLADLLREDRMQHVHSPWADRYAFISLIAAKILNVPYSVQVRAHDIHRKTFQYALQEKFENARFIVSNCRYNESCVSSFAVRPDRLNIYTIYEGIDPARFSPAPRRRRLVQPVTILSVARPIEQKGLHHLLRALTVLKAKEYRYKCEIIGDPEQPLYSNYYAELRVLQHELDLDEPVAFLGAQSFSRVVEANVTADIFVLPCVLAGDGSRDITPNSLMEAMAMGLAVISTDITGIPEIVEDGVDGLLVAPDDEQALAEAIIRLIDDFEFRMQLGLNARTKVKKKFNINKNITRYVDLFTNGGDMVRQTSC